MSAANWGFFGGGGGLNIFFRGQNVHQVLIFRGFWAFQQVRCLTKLAAPPTCVSIADLQFRCPRTGHKNPPRPEIRKEYEKKKQNPPPWLGQENTKKLPKKIQKWPENDHFCIFSVIFSYFPGPTQGGGFCNFFVVFRISGHGGFLCPVRARRNCNRRLSFIQCRAGVWKSLRSMHPHRESTVLPSNSTGVYIGGGFLHTVGAFFLTVELLCLQSVTVLIIRDTLSHLKKTASSVSKKSSSEKVFVSQERVSGFPEKGADLRGSPGNFQGSLGNFRGTSGLLFSSTVRGLPGKSPKTFGEVRETSGKSPDFPEARVSLTPSQRLAKFISKLQS